MWEKLSVSFVTGVNVILTDKRCILEKSCYLYSIMFIRFRCGGVVRRVCI